jgi:hypothetical protein
MDCGNWRDARSFRPQLEQENALFLLFLPFITKSCPFYGKSIAGFT